MKWVCYCGINALQWIKADFSSLSPIRIARSLCLPRAFGRAFQEGKVIPQCDDVT